MLVDTHCHLGDAAFDADRAEVVARARAAGVGAAVIVADTIAASHTAARLATEFGLTATAGVHPHAAATWSAGSEVELEQALTAAGVVAVGETGLDYHYDFASREAQRAAFEAQLALGATTGKPVVIHARKADDDMAAILREWGARARLILHSFSSGPGVFEAAMEAGAYVSFSGMVTFRNWDGAAYVTACPSDRILVETDAPYLAPAPHRGRRNEPAWVTEVARRVAELRDTPPEMIATITTANAIRCFGSAIAHTASETS
ncbi:MAG: TatD family hydrolase [Gemmatimonadales bacterium]